MSLKQNEPKVEKVAGRKFYIRPFPAFKASRLTGELASVLAPILGALLPLVGDNGDLMNVDASVAANAISGCAALDGEKLEKLMKALLLGGHIATEIEDEDGKKEPVRLDEDLVNELFCGEIQDMFVLCFHVIKLNFSGFFKNLVAQSGGAESAEKKKARPIL